MLEPTLARRFGPGLRFPSLLFGLITQAAWLLCAATTFAAAPHVLDLPESAVASGALAGDEDRLEARLLVDADGSRVGVLFDIDPGWHLYWHNPGETGLPTELDWEAPGVRFGDLAWPVPQRFTSSETELTSYGYEEQVLLASPIEGRPRTGVIAVDVDLLVCSTECVPAQLRLQRNLDAALNARSPAAANTEASLFDAFAAQVPVTPASLGITVESRYSRSKLRPGDAFEFAFVIEPSGAPITRASFYPDAAVTESLEIDALSPFRSDDRPGADLLEANARVGDDVGEPLERLTGVLEFEHGEADSHAVRIDLALPTASASTRSIALGRHWRATPPSATPAIERSDRSREAIPSSPGWLALLRFLSLAFLGGLLINAMPCVLPVLGIKICSIATLAQRDRRELMHHGFAYATGSLITMGALATVVVALRAAGTKVGWGFQFQEPFFVAAVTAVVVLFALNLFGVFEIHLASPKLGELGAEAHGVRRSFFDGLLAVVLATPCTAPFLGTAVGFAFAGDTFQIFAVFFAIGAGLAAPYTAICLVPGWARFVPKPGNWMLRLRTGLGFLLMGTAVWLLWIFGRNAGVDGIVMMLALLVALAFGAWLLGWVQTLHHHRAALLTSAALLVFTVGGLNVVRTSVASPPVEERPEPGWRPHDLASIQRSLAADEPVFVSFTADWCITCKLNERVVLADERIEAAFTDLGFARYRGDWTQRDEAIRAELARHGRAGVPLYLVYDPSTPDHPRVLPELLTVDGLLESLAAASPRAGAASPPSLAAVDPR